MLSLSPSLLTYFLGSCTGLVLGLIKVLESQTKQPGQHDTSTNVEPMLGHRLRRWPNNGPTLGGCLVFAGNDQSTGSTVVCPVINVTIPYAVPFAISGFSLSCIRLQLKGLAQTKIIKKSVILFWLLNMTIWCKYVHRLELQKFLNFSAAHSPVRLDIETKFQYF